MKGDKDYFEIQKINKIIKLRQNIIKPENKYANILISRWVPTDVAKFKVQFEVKNKSLF